MPKPAPLDFRLPIWFMQLIDEPKRVNYYNWNGDDFIKLSGTKPNKKKMNGSGDLN